MRFHAECALCLFQQRFDRAKDVADQRLRAEYARELARVISEVDFDRDSSPLMGARLAEVQRRMLGIEDDYTEINRRFNGMMLNLYPELRARVFAAKDPIYAAMQLSLAGNYIDFGVLLDVTEEKLMELIRNASDCALDAAEYANLRADLARGGELVYLHDNCGEVVLDKLLIEAIRAEYPQLHVLSVLRGSPILNDATVEDALEVGLDAVSDEVIGNGLRDTAGTELEYMPAELRARIERATLIIGKGQGNFETLIGSGLNVYFLLLAKCAGYQRWFGLKQYSAVLANERRMRHMDR